MSTLLDRAPMPTPFLTSVAEKVFNHVRLSSEDALQLLQTEEPDALEAVRSLADHVRREKVGDSRFTLLPVSSSIPQIYAS